MLQGQKQIFIVSQKNPPTQVLPRMDGISAVSFQGFLGEKEGFFLKEFCNSPVKYEQQQQYYTPLEYARHERELFEWIVPFTRYK